MLCSNSVQSTQLVIARSMKFIHLIFICTTMINTVFFSGYLLIEQVKDLTKSTETALCQDTSMPTGKFVTILHYKWFIVAMYPDDFVSLGRFAVTYYYFFLFIFFAVTYVLPENCTIPLGVYVHVHSTELNNEFVCH